MADFATLDSNSHNIPFQGDNVADNALNLTNPDSILSGNNRGIQNLGGPNLYADSGANQMVVQPTTVPQVLMGNQKTFGEGFYVAKPNVNVITNTDASQFIFNSNQTVLQVARSSSVLLSYSFSSHTAVNNGQDSASVTISYSDLKLTKIPTILLTYDPTSTVSSASPTELVSFVDGSLGVEQQSLGIFTANLSVIFYFKVTIFKTSTTITYFQDYSVPASGGLSTAAVSRTMPIYYNILTPNT